jgi:hypothetical protein
VIQRRNVCIDFNHGTMNLPLILKGVYDTFVSCRAV